MRQEPGKIASEDEMDIVNLLGGNENLLRLIGINTLLAFSLFVTLSSGQFQVAQPVFMAVSGYSGALMSLHLDLPFVLVVASAVAMSCAVSMILAPLLMRLTGVFLALATFVIVGLVSVIAINVEGLGGAEGLYNVPRRVTTLQIFIAVLVVFVLLASLRRSQFGRAMRLAAEDPVVAAGTGLNVARVQRRVFALSAAIAGLAFCLRVHTFYQVGPGDFGLVRILDMLTFVVVGGMGNVLGPVVGAFSVTFIGNEFQSLEDWRVVFNGALLLLVMLFLPDGLTSFRLRRPERFSRRR